MVDPDTAGCGVRIPWAGAIPPPCSRGWLTVSWVCVLQVHRHLLYRLRDDAGLVRPCPWPDNDGHVHESFGNTVSPRRGVDLGRQRVGSSSCLGTDHEIPDLSQAVGNLGDFFYRFEEPPLASLFLVGAWVKEQKPPRRAVSFTRCRCKALGDAEQEDEPVKPPRPVPG